MTEITFLHLSDLHFGVTGMQDVWDRIRQNFFDDLEHLTKLTQSLDLVLFTGDLTQRGDRSEFGQVSAFLTSLWDHFASLGLKPSFLAVPGNHDLTRPGPRDPAHLLLTDMWSDERVNQEFWDDPRSAYRLLVGEAFANYQQWWDQLDIPKLAIRPGCITGDFSATFSKGKVRLGIVGFNTAFLQLNAGVQPTSLVLGLKQFREVCGDGPKWVRAHDTCLLLTHHPPEWLRNESVSTLEGEIHSPPESFALHLFGHMHEPDLRIVSIGGGAGRRRLQGAALFSNEPWGNPPVKTRLCGYSIGKLNFQDNSLTFELWPRKAGLVRGVGWQIQLDQENFSVPPGAQSTSPTPVTLWSRRTPNSTGVETLPGGPDGRERAPPRGKYAALVGPSTLAEVHNLMAEILTRPDLPTPVRIRNIALDMERTWGLIRDDIMGRSWPKTLEWRSLMVDGSADAIKALQAAGPLISAQMADTQEAEIRKFCSSQADAIAEKNLSFACRAYAEVPFMHGFLVDDRILFVAFCSNDGTKLTTSPYIRLDRKPRNQYELDTTTAAHFIKAFNGWFDARWENTRHVWQMPDIKDH